MEHLALEIFDLDTADGRKAIGSQYANLPENASITITDTSEIFASGDVWSHSFTLNIFANLHIFGSSGDIHGSRLHEQINKRRARLWVEGLPLYLGYLKLDDEVDVDEDGNVDVTFESGQKTFEDMIEGAKANQVPMMGDVQIGMALWRKRVIGHKLTCYAYPVFSDGSTELSTSNPNDHVYISSDDGNGNQDIILNFSNANDDTDSVQQYPRMVFPKGTFKNMSTNAEEPVDCLNTDIPYDDAHPYCNTALCYQKYGYKRTNEDGSTYDAYNSDPEAQRGYEYMPANRVNSAPNFYVIYWLRCLLKHLGIYIEENQMMDVEDLRRLFLVNTNCDYIEPEKLRSIAATERYGKYKFGSAGRLVAEYLGPKEEGVYKLHKLTDIEKSMFTGTDVQVGAIDDAYGPYVPDMPAIDHVVVKVSKIEPWTEINRTQYEDSNNYLHRAIATSDCFPSVDISEVIGAIENGFGVRLLFSEDYKRVRIVLLRNIFRNQDVQDIVCEIADDDVKVENSIRGFRMTYGDNKEDTHFYYKGFNDMLPHKSEMWVDDSDTHDYSHWNLDADYATLIHKISAFDKTCYVTPNNGNASIIKVDKDAKRYDEMRQSLFEAAGFMDAEDGDCTGEDATIKTVTAGFTPAIMNDVNFENERDNGTTNQQFALFVDETMRPRRPDLKDGTDYNNSDAVYDADKLYEENSVASGMKADGIVKPGEFSVTSDAYMSPRTVHIGLSVWVTPQGVGSGDYWKHYPVTMSLEGHLNEGYRLYLQDNYEPNDDGVSPIETHDWGLTLGIMRGSGSDAYVAYEPDTIENENPKNDTWKIVAGSSVTAHPDTCDNYGHLWDYDIEAGRRYLAEDLTAAGWGVTAAADGMASCTYHFLLDGVDFLCTPIKYTRPGAGLYWNPVLTQAQLEAYVTGLWNEYGWNFGDYDSWKIVLSAKNASGNTAYADGRFSLKLRAEKPNPYFNPALEENSTTNRRYLKITNKNLQGRGLCDQFYKEYSYWVRNARIVKRTVRMELAQLLAIDKTVRVTVGDVTGFIRKMQYSVSNKTGLGEVTMEIMYI